MASIAEILALVNSDPVSARTLRAVLEFVLSRNIETDHLAFDHGNLAGLTDDDHAQYQKESEKDVASGYAGLDTDGLVPAAELGSGTPSVSTLLNGNRAWQAAAGCGLRKASGTNISNVTETAMTFDTEDFDVGGCHDGVNPTRITVPTGYGGKWLISGQVVFDDNATGDRYASIFLNATTYLAFASTKPPTGANINSGVQVSCVADLAAGDYVELNGYQSSGGLLIALGGTSGCRLQAWRLF